MDNIEMIRTYDLFAHPQNPRKRNYGFTLTKTEWPESTTEASILQSTSRTERRWKTSKHGSSTRVRMHSENGERKMARKRKTTKKMQETKNTIMKLSTSGIEIRTRQSISADEIASRPPYMYTTLCPDPRYRI